MHSANTILTIFYITWQTFFKDCNLCSYYEELIRVLAMVTVKIVFVGIYAYNLDQ